jgi:formylglycine-generating enzyme required for sulfatase activity
VDSVSYDAIRGRQSGAAWPRAEAVDPDSFLGLLRQRTQQAFDLPTEAQWERGCRAGETTAHFFGNATTDLHRHANYRDISSGLPAGKDYWNRTDLEHDDGHEKTAPVGSYMGNAFGLHDTHGNLKEWCRDWLQSDLGTELQQDPAGPMDGKARVLRGGSWDNVPHSCRAAFRWGYAPDVGYNMVGFRLALTIEEDAAK